MTYGYARVSTRKQSIARQEENIKKVCESAKIFSEAFTGTTEDRPQWKRLKSMLKCGDTVIFDSVSRMSRNAAEGVDTYFKLYEMGVNLVFIKEPYINTDTYKDASEQKIDSVDNDIANIYIEATNKVLKLLAVKQIEIAFDQAQKEVDDIRQRTKEGMKKSGAADKISEANTGKTKTTKKGTFIKGIIIAMSKDFSGDKADTEILEYLESTGNKVNRNTYYKYKKEALIEKGAKGEQI